MSELEWMDIFSNNLMDILIERGMTQRDLSDESLISESTISRYIHKQQMPSLRAIINIAYSLDIDVGELIDFGERID